MELQCSVEDCIAVVCSRTQQRSIGREEREVIMQLMDPKGEQLSEIKVPWPDGEPEPSEIKYVDVEECIKLSNNATIATVPIRVSKLREILSNRRPASPPKRFTCFSNPSCPQEDSSQRRLYSALKNFVKDPLADGTWKRAFKCLSANGADADGFLTKDEQYVVIHFIPVQSFTSKELKNICEVLKRTNVFGPSCLGTFYELCLNLKQIPLVRSVIQSNDPLSEKCLAVFLNFVAALLSEQNTQESDKDLLAHLLQRQFDPRRLSDAAARKITIEHVQVLLRECMDIYVLTKDGDIAEQALLLMSLLTDTFGKRLVWESDLHDVAKEALDFSEKLSDIMSSFIQLDLKRTHIIRAEEEDLYTLYKIEKISLPRRPLNW